MLGRAPTAIHVDGHDHVAKPCQLFGALAGVAVQAPPLMHQQDTGSTPLRLGIACDQAYVLLTIGPIGHRLRDHLRPLETIDQRCILGGHGLSGGKYRLCKQQGASAPAT